VILLFRTAVTESRAERCRLVLTFALLATGITTVPITEDTYVAIVRTAEAREYFMVAVLFLSRCVLGSGVQIFEDSAAVSISGGPVRLFDEGQTKMYGRANGYSLEGMVIGVMDALSSSPTRQPARQITYLGRTRQVVMARAEASHFLALLAGDAIGLDLQAVCRTWREPNHIFVFQLQVESIAWLDVGLGGEEERRQKKGKVGPGPVSLRESQTREETPTPLREMRHFLVGYSLTNKISAIRRILMLQHWSGRRRG
jgi:hypothetical protein